MATLNNQRGAVLITAIVILALLTIIGMAATNTSMLETMISATEKTRAEAFYAAEAGIAHQRRNFKSLFQEANKAKLAAGDDPDWDFALQGPDGVFDSGDEAQTPPGTDPPSYSNGARWITKGDLTGNYHYNVRVWDNDDGGTAGNEHLDDTDGLIFLRADARVPGGGSASIEILLKGTTTDGKSISGYGAQEGGGAGKNYAANDVDAVDTTSTQIQ